MNLSPDLRREFGSKQQLLPFTKKAGRTPPPPTTEGAGFHRATDSSVENNSTITCESEYRTARKSARKSANV